MFKKVLFIVIMLITACTSCFAAKIDASKYMTDVAFVEEPWPTTYADITFQPVIPMTGVNMDIVGGEDTYGDSYGSLSVTGIGLMIKNDSDSVAVISWKDSTINVDGDSFGVPFFPGMKYRDAGNPAAVANTVLGPGKSTQVIVFIPVAKMHYKHWNLDGIPLSIKSNRIVNIYAAVNINGGTNYVDIETPGINLKPEVKVKLLGK